MHSDPSTSSSSLTDCSIPGMTTSSPYRHSKVLILTTNVDLNFAANDGRPDTSPCGNDRAAESSNFVTRIDAPVLVPFSWSTGPARLCPSTSLNRGRRLSRHCVVELDPEPELKAKPTRTRTRPRCTCLSRIFFCGLQVGPFVPAGGRCGTRGPVGFPALSCV